MKARWPVIGVAKHLMAALALLALILASAPEGHAQVSSRVGLVVDLGDGTMITQVVTVAKAAPTGYEILQASGLELVAQQSGMGVAICAIADTGCPASNCFCDSPPNNWTYWYLEGGAWVYSPVGAAGRRAQDGDVEGWRWGSGDPPPVYTFEELENSAAGSASAGGVSALQAYPAPETPVVLDPAAPVDAYPPPEETAPVLLEPYPGPGEEETLPTTPTPSPSVLVAQTGTLTPVTTALRPTYTSTSGTPQPQTEAPTGVTTAPAQTPAVTVAASPGLPDPAHGIASATVTPDRAAILISTAVALEKTSQAMGEVDTVPSDRSYIGFAVLALVLLALSGYVYLLRRQRQADASGRDDH